MMLMLPGILRSLLECCSELQHVAVRCSVVLRLLMPLGMPHVTVCVTMSYSVLQCVGVCCNVDIRLLMLPGMLRSVCVCACRCV